MVRTYKKKRADPTYTEEDMAQAISEVLNKKKSVRNAAAAYGIKTMTLQNRILSICKELPKSAVEDETESEDGNIEAVEPVFDIAPRMYKYQSKYSSQQVFSSSQELLLAEYLIKSSEIQYGLSYKQVRSFAYSYANHLSLHMPQSWIKNKMAGVDWVKLFMKRHPLLSLRKPENTSLSRATSFNAANVKEFFDNYERAITRYKITPERIYNLDETGVTTVMQAPKVIARAGAKQVGQAVSAERGELVTLCAIVNAVGNAVPPVYIFPRKRFKNELLKGSPPGSLGLANPSGWMNGITFLETIKHVQKHTHCNVESPILILLDNHESHATLEVILYCRDNGVVFVTFPPHCTHRLQPLDVGLYGPFKGYCKTVYNDWMVSHPGRTITIYDIPELTAEAYRAAFTIKNILSAFKKTGIAPLNRLVFNESDFQSSYVTDRPEPIATTMGEDPTSPSTNIPSTSKTVGVQITPESVRPYPKVQQPRKKMQGRKRGKSRILTETPEKLRIEEETKLREKKKEAQEKNKHKFLAQQLFPQIKKPRLHTDYASSEDEDNPEEMPQSDSDLEEKEFLAKPRSPNMITLQSGTYVVVKLSSKKSSKHFVGLLMNKNSMEDYTIKFMKRKDGSPNGFIWPQIDDQSIVSFEEVIGVLDQPSIDRRGINYFKCDLSYFSNLN